ncbi:MAG TPA: hypothetical protein VFR81_28635 [Longimicrobium sp.]|nr:hypothetical protein [Longimicrobium sp.]
MDRKTWLFPATLLLALAACDGSTTGADGGSVAVRFATSPAARASLAPSAAAAPGFSHAGTSDVLAITGSNGTLRIEDIRLIVSELELEQAEGSCAGEDDGGDDCEEFESGPFLVDLPLSGGAVTLATDRIAPGSYDELDFEVENLESDDDDDTGERQAIQALLAQLRGVYPGFPSRASMVAHGTFTPAGSTTAQPFTVYFNAEIEVEMDLSPPVTVPGTTALTVEINPALWFRDGAQVVNLAALDGRTIEFHSQLRDGIEEVDEID